MNSDLTACSHHLIRRFRLTEIVITRDNCTGIVVQYTTADICISLEMKIPRRKVGKWDEFPQELDRLRYLQCNLRGCGRILTGGGFLSFPFEWSVLTAVDFPIVIAQAKKSLE